MNKRPCHGDPLTCPICDSTTMVGINNKNDGLAIDCLRCGHVTRLLYADTCVRPGDALAAIAAKDAEIADLKAENVCRDYRLHDFLAYTERFLDRQEKKMAEGQAIINAKESEIAKLRKVVEAARAYEEARRALGVALLFCDEASDRLEKYVLFTDNEEGGLRTDLDYLMLGCAYAKSLKAFLVHRTILRVYEQRLSDALAELEKHNG